MLRRECPRDTSANRVAHQAGAGDTQPVHQCDEDPQRTGVRVVAFRVGPGQPGAWQIETDHAHVARQGLRPTLPGVQARSEAVQQDHHRRGLGPAVAHMQTDAGNLDEVVRRVGVFGFQRGAVAVGRPQPIRQKREQHRHDGGERLHCNIPSSGIMGDGPGGASATPAPESWSGSALSGFRFPAAGR